MLMQDRVETQDLLLDQRSHEGAFKFLHPPPGGSSIPNPSCKLPPLLVPVPFPRLSVSLFSSFSERFGSLPVTKANLFPRTS